MKVKWNLDVVRSTGNNFDFVTGFKEGAAFYFKNAKAAKRK
jgi:hypothetical protein